VPELSRAWTEEALPLILRFYNKHQFYSAEKDDDKRFIGTLFVRTVYAVYVKFPEVSSI
jgi:hypothetical protein